MKEVNDSRKFEATVITIVEKYLKSSAFVDRKLTDMPTDALQVVPRKYVTLNGVTSARPVTSVIGQRYFDTSLNKPIWIGNGYAWVDATGTPI